MVSLTISEEVLKREGEELIDQLKNSLDEYEDLFRMRSFCSSFFETIKRMKEDLNIAEFFIGIITIKNIKKIKQKIKRLDL